MIRQNTGDHATNQLVWSSLPPRVKYSHISHFVHLSSRRLRSLSVDEQVLFFQWLFEVLELATVKTEIREEYFDLELVNVGQQNQHEYARIYLGKPIAAVYSTTTRLQGRNINKIHLITFEKFPPADWSAKQESPLFLELREATDTILWIGKCRAMYRKSLNDQRDYYPAPEELFGKARRRSWWSKIRRLFS